MNPYLEKLQKEYDKLKHGTRIPERLEGPDSVITIRWRKTFPTDHMLQIDETMKDEASPFNMFTLRTVSMWETFETDSLIKKRKSILSYLKRLLKDSKDMESFGYEQTSFSKFRRNDIVVENAQNGIRISWFMTNDLVSERTFHNVCMKQAVAMYEKKNTEDYMSLTEALRDEIIKVEEAEA